MTHSTGCVDLEIGPGPLCLSSEEVFRIVSIAHHYDMQLLLKWCNKAIERVQLDLWPSAPIASSQMPKHPGLLQWLALADAKQCAPLVETWLSQLLCQESNAAIHEAVTSPHLRHMIDGLRLETKMSMLYKMAGLPLGFQVPLNSLFHTNEVLHLHACCLPRFGWSACTCAHTCCNTKFVIHIWCALLQGRIPEINRLQPDISLKVRSLCTANDSFLCPIGL